MPEKVLLVTGAGGEIGGFLVNEFLTDGWIVCGLDLESPSNLGVPRFMFDKCDLSDSGDVERKIDRFHERFGAFDAVLNCAALIANSPLISFVEGNLTHHDFELWDRVLSSTLSSAFYVTACTVPKMVSAGKKAVIINFSSICSRGNPGQAAYSAAKAGLNGLTAALSKEMGPMGIRVVALAPGYIDSASTRQNVLPQKLKAIKSAVPLRRLGSIEEVASSVKFILNNEYLTGTVIEVNGGLVL